MDPTLDYRQKAAECRALAAHMRRAEDRASLLALARSWDRMADLRERSGEAAGAARRA